MRKALLGAPDLYDRVSRAWYGVSPYGVRRLWEGAGGWQQIGATMRCALILAVLSAGTSVRPEWRNIGPGGGGWIQSVCAGLHNVDRLYVGCDVGGFYRSDNGGRSYTILNSGLWDYWVECIVCHPSEPDTIYLGCESGVYRSGDGGRAWEWLRNGFPAERRYGWSAPIGALAIDPRAPDTLYAGIGRPRRSAFGRGALYKTTDAGVTWAQANEAGSLPDDALISDLLIDPADSRRLYLACPNGVYQSHDAGATWSRTIDGLPHPHVRRLAYCPAEPTTLYLTLHSPPGQEPWQGGVYKSVDRGVTWAPAGLGSLSRSVGKPGQPGPLTANYDRIAVHPRNPDIVYVGGASWVNATLYKSIDGGGTWHDVVRRRGEVNIDQGWLTMWGPTVKCLSVSPVDPDVVVFGTSGAVFRSRNAGRTWEQAYTELLPDGRVRGTGLEVTCVHMIRVHPADPRRLYVGYYDIGLLVSSDRGDTFRRCVDGIFPRELRNSCFAVAFDPRDPEHCWGSFGAWGSNRGVVAESSDGGVSWALCGHPDTGLPDARHRTLIVETEQGEGAARLFTTADGHGVYASADGGETWEARNQGLPHLDVRALVRHPQSPAVFWCALDARGAALATVCRSDDYCRTWGTVSRDLDAADLKRMVAGPGANPRLYIAARNKNLNGRIVTGGLLRSDDGGASWRRVLEDDFVQGLAVDPSDPDVVYAGLTDHPYHDRCTGDGVVMSRDGGRNWISLNGAGLTCLQVGCIVIDPHSPGRVYLGTGGNSVFVGRVPVVP